MKKDQCTPSGFWVRHPSPLHFTKLLSTLLLSLSLSLSFACRKSPAPESSLPLPALPPDAPAAATAILDPPAITIGTPSTLTLQIVHPADATPTLPPLADPPRIVLLGSAPPSTTPHPTDPSLALTTATYSLTSLVVTNENLVAPSNTIALSTGATIPFPFANLEVQSTLTPDTTLNPSITTLRHWPLPLRKYLLYAALALLALVALSIAAFFLLRHLRRVQASRPAPPPPPPHLVALDALSALRATLSPSTLPEPFFVALSSIVRTYLEARFSLPVTTATTEEFLRDPATSSALSTSHRSLLADFLTQSDLVKFARLSPPLPALSSALTSATTLVTQTAPSDSPSSPSP